jgi:hypothetical protein
LLQATGKQESGRRMGIKRVYLLLKYILAAGQEDPGHRELGPIHLSKRRESGREKEE